MANLSRFFMKSAFLLSQESKCVSLKVGALIVNQGRIISMGYNGTAPGALNCNDVFDEDNFDRDRHHTWSTKNEIHAEMNALLFAAKNGISVEGSDMYVTLSPCNDCLKNLAQSGIKNVYYFYEYKKSDLEPSVIENMNIRNVFATSVKEFIERNELKTLIY